MFSIGVAFRAFFASLFNRDTSQRVADALDGQARLAPPTPKSEATRPTKPTPPPEPPKPTRSDAVALLELMQREARLVDFLMESIDEYDDAQVGAAVRDVHRGCREVVQRIFDLQPGTSDPEGGTVNVSPEYSAGRYRLVGNVSGNPPYQGELLHHGWLASRVDLPKWTGGNDDRMVISPIEVEVK